MTITPDELLTTTRAVRKRLDFTRPVDRVLVVECLEIALQAPSASNSQPWHFVVVTDPARKEAIAGHYRTSWGAYSARSAGSEGRTSRIVDSASYLAERFGEVPVHVVACVRGRTEELDATGRASLYGSALQACWSFQLAARARGLGTCFTTLHLAYEREVAAILGIPYDGYTQVGLITLGHTTGGEFRPAERRPLERVVHWDRW